MQRAAIFFRFRRFSAAQPGSQPQRRSAASDIIDARRFIISSLTRRSAADAADDAPPCHA
jgi:hypothetical protein